MTERSEPNALIELGSKPLLGTHYRLHSPGCTAGQCVCGNNEWRIDRLDGSEWRVCTQCRRRDRLTPNSAISATQGVLVEFFQPERKGNDDREMCKLRVRVHSTEARMDQRIVLRTGVRESGCKPPPRDNAGRAKSLSRMAPASHRERDCQQMGR